ncbi:MAG TPA: hypothetical protein VGO07_07345 [Candidatus Saccharimonadales bacterium]|nr:hypothetical protein [Candidatus Saccharimonadales bacterium]
MIILLASTVGWSIASARLQQGNADQLVSGFLFENDRTFTGATFPASHTQLIKWPLFAALRLFGFSAGIYLVLTVLLTIATVGAFAYILYRVNKNLLIFGTLCLGLASVLVLIPVQIFDGVTAPLNIAMLTGRNMEYIVYLGALALFIQAQQFASWRFLAATFLATLLAASDHLFLILSLGGATSLFITAWLLGHRQLHDAAKRWLAGSAAAGAGAALLQAVIGRVTHIVNDPLPYGALNSWHAIWPGIVGTAKALGLNAGLTMRAGLLTILPVLLNAAVVIGVAVAAYWLAKKIYALKGRPTVRLPDAVLLATMAATTAVVAIVTYALTNQPYVEHARYLTIVLFTSFVTLAVYLRNSRQLNAHMLAALGIAAVAAVALGLFGTIRHTNQLLAHDRLRQRNQRIALLLKTHPVELLVGDYWRVFPVKLLSAAARQAVVPLDGCVANVQLLNSAAWRPDLRRHSFAYILPLRSLSIATPRCSRQNVTLLYGPPTSTAVIAGNQRHPEELLLFYDEGAYDR